MDLDNLHDNTTGDNSSAGTKPDTGKKRRSQMIITALWSVFLGIGLIIAVFLMLIYNGVIGYMPPIEELEDPHDKLASVIYASNGTTELGRYFAGRGNRVYTDYDSISPYITDALIATEDARFYSHSGIDFKALMRSGIKTVLLNDKSAGGGSTITQQLAKQLYTQPSGSRLKRAMQKPIEWMIAIKLERFYTKEEIINMYLNRFDFLNNAVGIKTAANVYFGKEPDELRAEEAAMLVGMLKNPSFYNPLRFPERTMQRRNVVIEQMVKMDSDKYTRQWADSLKALPITLDYHRVDHKSGEVPYLREEIRRLMTAKRPQRPNRDNYSSQVAWTIALGNYNTDSTQWENNPLYGWIEKNPKSDGSLYNLYTDGLKIYTAIDLTMQHYAEDAVYEYMGGTLQPAFSREKSGLRTGPYSTDRSEVSEATVRNLIKNSLRQTERYRTMKAAGHSDAEIDAAFQTPYEMEVFAYVKDENGKYRPGRKSVVMSPYDSLLYIKSILRVGMMSMDPATGYVKAYIGGPDYFYFQYDMVSQGKRQIGSTAKPFLYTLAMEQGYTPCSTLLNSQPTYGEWSPRNSGSSMIGEMVTLKWALTQSNNWISARLVHDLQPINLANKMRMFGISGHIDATLPLALGTVDVSVRDMVGAYTAFANDGLRVDPIFVTRIEDNQGNLIYSATPHHTEVMNRTAYYKIVDMLINVVRHGTGAGLSRYGITAETAGKTGTTNSNSDTWFIGVTPDLVTGVWVGGEERYIHFNTMSLGQGARAALPIYGLYMRALYSNPRLGYSQDSRFAIPDDVDLCEGESWLEDDRENDYEEVSEGMFN